MAEENKLIVKVISHAKKDRKSFAQPLKIVSQNKDSVCFCKRKLYDRYSIIYLHPKYPGYLMTVFLSRCAM